MNVIYVYYTRHVFGSRIKRTMNVNGYTKRIVDEINSNTHLSDADKSAYRNIFANSSVMVRKHSVTQEFADLVTYSNHFNVEDFKRAYDMYEAQKTRTKENENALKRYQSEVFRADFSVQNSRICGNPVTVPVPPDDFPNDTVSRDTLERGTVQKRIFCALQNPATIESFTRELGDLKRISSGQYGEGFLATRMHSMRNQGVLVKLFTSKVNTSNDMQAYYVGYETNAAYQINDLIPLSQNFTYTYGMSNNYRGCIHLKNQSPQRSPNTCRSQRSSYVLSEFVSKSESWYDWFDREAKNLRTRKSVTNMLDVYVQLVGALSYLANVKRSVHNDIHGDNILVQTLSEPITLTYFFPSGYKYSVTTNTVVRVIDYGFMSYVNRQGQYVMHFQSNILGAFMPASDIYRVTTSYMRNLYREVGVDKKPGANFLMNLFANIIIYGIYGRKGAVDTRVTNTLLTQMTKIDVSGKDDNWRKNILPNWGGHSNVLDTDPNLFEDIIRLINRMIVKDEYAEHYVIMKGTSSIMPETGYEVKRVNKRDLEFLRQVSDSWTAYTDIIRKQHDNKDRISQDAFMRNYHSDGYKEFRSAVKSKRRDRITSREFEATVRPMMIQRAESMGIRNMVYLDAVMEFEDTLIEYYNMLAPGRHRDLLDTYFEIIGIVILP